MLKTHRYLNHDVEWRPVDGLNVQVVVPLSLRSVRKGSVGMIDPNPDDLEFSPKANVSCEYV